MKGKMFSWSIVLLLALVALSVQGCFGGGSTGKQIGTSTSGRQVSVQQNAFKGKFFLTINHNLYVINSDGSSQVLVNTGNVYDPALSPDGKSIAFIEKFKDYSDLCMVATTGGQVQVLRNGNGHFYHNGPFIHDTFYWYAQPTWSPDGSNLLFLSDWEKEDWYAQTTDAPMLDLQVFSIPLSEPTTTPVAVAYASFGDGGNHDVSYRPGHPDQIIYTHYAYDPATETQQLIQLFMENPATISLHPRLYYPGMPGGGFDPGIAITDGKLEDLQPAFSPDGNAIAYVQRNAAGTAMRLNVMPTPPDAITQTPNDANTETLALQAYQTQSSTLLSSLYIEQPVWSPDGKQIAYITFNSGSFDLWITNVLHNPKTGAYTVQGSPIQVTNGGVDGEVRPVWSA